MPAPVPGPIQPPAIRTQELRFRYARASGNDALRGVSLEIGHGEAVALVGPNGSGKTTLLRLLCRVLEPSGGSAWIEGRDVRAYARPELARRVAVVPQKAEFAFDYTVREVVMMGRIPHQGALGIEKREDRRAVDAALGQAGIEALAGRSVRELSGGELQLTMIARALAQQSPILLLDEPTSALDLGHQQQVLALLRELREHGSRTLLLVTHDLNLAARESRRIVLFQNGAIAAQGTPAEVLTPEHIERVYGARTQVHATPGRPGTPWIHLD